jgi:uncharacterized SAM-binding protein YcdF (DUF218 family)
MKKVLASFLVFITAAFAITAISIYRYGSTEAATNADAAIVLGAAVWGDEPSPVFDERIAHAIRLFQSNSVQFLIFTGGVGKDDRLSEAEVGRRVAVAAGVPTERILVDEDSAVTYENLENAKRLADMEDLTTFLIVSDPMHMKRATEIARDLGMSASPSPTPTTRYQTWGSKLPFLLRETYYYLSYRIRRIFST